MAEWHMHNLWLPKEICYPAAQLGPALNRDNPRFRILIHRLHVLHNGGHGVIGQWCMLQKIKKKLGIIQIKVLIH